MENPQMQFKFKDIIIFLKEMIMPPHKVDMNGAFYFDFKIDVKIIEAEKLGIWITEAKIRDKEEDDGTHLARFVVGCVFEFINFEEIFHKTDTGLFDVPLGIDNIFRPVSISTTRGIIYSELRGTYLNRAIMPVIFMDQLVPIQTADSF